MSEDNSFFPFFLDEAADILANWEKACLDYEQTGNLESAEMLYRSAHNLKSGSAAVGLGEFRDFVHQIEELISKLIAGKISQPQKLLQLLLEAQSTFTNWIGKLRSDQKFIPADLSEKSRLATQLLAQVNGSDDLVILNSAEEDPKANAIEEPIDENLEKKVPNLIASQPQTSTVNRSSETVRVAANKLDMLIQFAGEISTQQAIVWHARQNGKLHAKSCDNAIQLMQKIAKDLQGLALSLRMQPLQTLFQRLERASLDLARAQEKAIEIVTVGEHVELDRAVIERITEALMHVIRNAVDHGIETSEARLNQSKSETAKLYLEASPSPGGVTITIRDDGRGLNVERILKKAIEKNLAREDQSYTAGEIHRFIFLQGFSTAEKVTDISGRGVGMDVVKKAVEAIGGSIQVTSTIGQGTAFHISLPTTLSIMDVLIVEVDQCRYAVPVQDVSEIVDLSCLKLETASSRGRLLSLRSDIVAVEYLADHLPPMKRLAALTSEKDESAKNKNTIQPALLVRSGSHLMAFQVDAILAQQPVAIRPLPATLDQVAGYTGGSILGDGDPCVILSLPTLLRRHSESVGLFDLETDQGVYISESPSNHERATIHKHLIFRIADRLLAIPLAAIREINTSSHCQSTIGLRPLFLGCIDLRGEILPVLDLAKIVDLAAPALNGPIVIVDHFKTPWAFMVDKIEAVADLECDAERPKIARFRAGLISLIDVTTITENNFGFSAGAAVNQSQQNSTEFKGVS